jgi:hypothetical protein
MIGSKGNNQRRFMATRSDPYKLSKPTIYLGLMIVFLILAGFVILILSPQLSAIFYANPPLNALIVMVLALGVLLSLWQVVRLQPEVRWINHFRLNSDSFALRDPPRLLAPMATLLQDQQGRLSLSPQTARTLLDSIGMRLDETREISRYMIGLLVFLGLLGTFWGLTQTVMAVSDTISNLDVSGTEITSLFDNLKTGLAAPLDGMGTAFSSSLFGLAGSLILGFLDLQAGQAQNRFYTELEDWMSTVTELEENATQSSPFKSSGEALMLVNAAVEKLTRSIEERYPEHRADDANSAALANLAEGVQALVTHVRAEQKIVREWVGAQAEQQAKLGVVLDRLRAALEAEEG